MDFFYNETEEQQCYSQKKGSSNENKEIKNVQEVSLLTKN